MEHRHEWVTHRWDGQIKESLAHCECGAELFCDEIERRLNDYERLEEQLQQAQDERDALVRPCSGCDCSIQDCYDHRRKGAVACCPDCNHEATRKELET